MREFPVRTADQLSLLLQGFRKEAGFTQGETAERLGVTQQTLSALERNAASASVRRVLELLGVLGVELVLRHRESDTDLPSSASAGSDGEW